MATFSYSQFCENLKSIDFNNPPDVPSKIIPYIAKIKETLCTLLDDSKKFSVIINKNSGICNQLSGILTSYLLNLAKSADDSDIDYQRKCCADIENFVRSYLKNFPAIFLSVIYVYDYKLPCSISEKSTEKDQNLEIIPIYRSNVNILTDKMLTTKKLTDSFVNNSIIFTTYQMCCLNVITDLRYTKDIKNDQKILLPFIHGNSCNANRKDSPLAIDWKECFPLACLRADYFTNMPPTFLNNLTLDNNRSQITIIINLWAYLLQTHFQLPGSLSSVVIEQFTFISQLIKQLYLNFSCNTLILNSPAYRKEIIHYLERYVDRGIELWYRYVRIYLKQLDHYYENKLTHFNSINNCEFLQNYDLLHCFPTYLIHFRNHVLYLYRFCLLSMSSYFSCDEKSKNCNENDMTNQYGDKVETLLNVFPDENEHVRNNYGSCCLHLSLVNSIVKSRIQHSNVTVKKNNDKTNFQNVKNKNDNQIATSKTDILYSPQYIMGQNGDFMPGIQELTCRIMKRVLLHSTYEEHKSIALHALITFQSYEDRLQPVKWEEWFNLCDSPWPKEVLTSVYLLKYYIKLSENSCLESKTFKKSNNFIGTSANIPLFSLKEYLMTKQQSSGFTKMIQDEYPMLNTTNLKVWLINILMGEMFQRINNLCTLQTLQPCLYGMLQNIRYLLDDLLVSSNVKDLFEDNNYFQLKFIEELINFSKFVFQFVKDPAPEGYIANNEKYLEFVSKFLENDEDNTTIENQNEKMISPQAFAMYCWRALREISLLFPLIMKARIHYLNLITNIWDQSDNNPHFEPTQKMILRIHDFYYMILTQSLHMGTLELAYSGFDMFCKILFSPIKCKIKEGKKKIDSTFMELPFIYFESLNQTTIEQAKIHIGQYWLYHFLESIDTFNAQTVCRNEKEKLANVFHSTLLVMTQSQIKNDESYITASNIKPNICVTRRGAGLPFYLITLLCHVPHYVNVPFVVPYKTIGARVENISNGNGNGFLPQDMINNGLNHENVDGINMLDICLDVLIEWASNTGKKYALSQQILALNFIRNIYKDAHIFSTSRAYSSLRSEKMHANVDAVIENQNLDLTQITQPPYDPLSLPVTDKLLYRHLPKVLMGCIIPLYGSPVWPLKNLANLCFVPMGKRIFGNHFASRHTFATMAQTNFTLSLPGYNNNMSLNGYKRSKYTEMDYKEFRSKYLNLFHFMTDEIYSFSQFLCGSDDEEKTSKNENIDTEIQIKCQQIYPIFMLLHHLNFQSTTTDCLEEKPRFIHEFIQKYCNNSNNYCDNKSIIETDILHVFDTVFTISMYASVLVPKCIDIGMFCKDPYVNRLVARILIKMFPTLHEYQDKPLDIAFHLSLCTLILIYMHYKLEEQTKIATEKSNLKSVFGFSLIILQIILNPCQQQLQNIPESKQMHYLQKVIIKYFSQNFHLLQSNSTVKIDKTHKHIDSPYLVYFMNIYLMIFPPHKNISNNMLKENMLKHAVISMHTFGRLEMCLEATHCTRRWILQTYSKFFSRGQNPQDSQPNIGQNSEESALDYLSSQSCELHALLFLSLYEYMIDLLDNINDTCSQTPNKSNFALLKNMLKSMVLKDFLKSDFSFYESFLTNPATKNAHSNAQNFGNILWSKYGWLINFAKHLCGNITKSQGKHSDLCLSMAFFVLAEVDLALSTTIPDDAEKEFEMHLSSTKYMQSKIYEFSNAPMCYIHYLSRLFYHTYTYSQNVSNRTTLKKYCQFLHSIILQPTQTPNNENITTEIVDNTSEYYKLIFQIICKDIDIYLLDKRNLLGLQTVSPFWFTIFIESSNADPNISHLVQNMVETLRRKTFSLEYSCQIPVYVIIQIMKQRYMSENLNALYTILMDWFNYSNISPLQRAAIHVSIKQQNDCREFAISTNLDYDIAIKDYINFLESKLINHV